jgi:hypothetical protein
MRIPLLALALLGCLTTSAALGATFTVDSVGDEPDDNTADNVCHTAVNTCTFRAALMQSNATPGPDVIHFAIAGPGVKTIQPLSALPNISDPVTIDGYSQPGSSMNTLAVGNDAVLLIEIDGSAVGAVANGLTVFTTGCTIQGLVINRFTNNGIQIDATGGGAAGGHSILGNFIGTNPAGTVALGNAGVGLFIRSPNNLVGGSAPASRNLISGTTGNSNPFVANLKFEADFGATITGNVVQGNYIGTDKTGTVALTSSNGAAGIVVQSGTSGQGGVIIGGSSASARNVISGNKFFGVDIQSNPCTATTTSVVVAGNSIGTGAGGAALGNGYGGVHLGCGATGSVVGGNGAGAGNVIAYNGGGSFTGGGVLVDGSPGVPSGNAILGNSIYSNTKLAGGAVHAGLGIDLNTDGPTPNDAGDLDTGPNGLQNYPVLTSVTTNGSTSVTIQGSLSSVPGQTYHIEFFSSPSCDAYGYGEGQTFLGFVDVAANGSGIATINSTFPGTVLAGDSVTATATDSSNNTSEFSACFAAVQALSYYTVTPCRVVDTRNANGPYGGPALAANTDRTFVFGGQCGVPSNARAVSINIAVTLSTAGGDLRIFPAGTPLPLVSAINYNAGKTRANNAIAPLGASGDMTVHCDQPSGTVHVIVDIDGYFQ